MPKLSMSHTEGEGSGGTLGATPSPVGHGTASCTLLALPQEDFLALAL